MPSVHCYEFAFLIVRYICVWSSHCGSRCHSELHTNCVCSCTLSYWMQSSVFHWISITATSELSSRRGPHSASSQQYKVQWTTLNFGEWTFSFAGPAVWNALASDLHNLRTLEKQLKTYLFTSRPIVLVKHSNCNAPFWFKRRSRNDVICICVCIIISGQ